MHDALTQLIADAPSTDAARPSTAEPPAMYDVMLGGSNGALVMLSITPSQLVFHPTRCDAEFHSLPLPQIVEIDDGDGDGRAILELHLRSDTRTTRSQELESFARSLRKDQVQALAAAKDDRHIEGNVWLCLLLSDAYVAPEDITHSTDGIEAGWWVVNAVYYCRRQRSPRGYQLETRWETEKQNGRDVRVERMVERVLVVNHLIRLPSPVVFASLAAARQTPRLAEAAAQGPTKLSNPIRLLYDKEYYQIESSMPAV